MSLGIRKEGLPTKKVIEKFRVEKCRSKAGPRTKMRVVVIQYRVNAKHATKSSDFFIQEHRQMFTVVTSIWNLYLWIYIIWRQLNIHTRASLCFREIRHCGYTWQMLHVTASIKMPSETSQTYPFLCTTRKYYPCTFIGLACNRQTDNLESPKVIDHIEFIGLEKLFCLYFMVYW